MPRHPSTKFRPGNGKPRSVNRADRKINKWDKIADIPLDDEAHFHASQDNILLEGDEFRSDDDGDDEEVFGLKGMEDDDSDEDDGGEEEDVDDMTEETPSSRKKGPKSRAKSKKPAQSSSSEESESEDETWGLSKSAYYSSNAAQLESDDEEGNELEEQEAKRLQGKARDAMEDDDFGLGDSLDVGVNEDVDELMEPPPPVIQPLPQDKKSLIRHLERNCPETLALARDWDDTARSLTKTHQKIARLESEEPDALSLGMIHLHYQALLTYVTTLAFYLHLRASEKYAHRPELLRSHPVFMRLLTLKQSLTTLEDLDIAVSDSEDDEDEDKHLRMYDGDDMLVDAEQVWKLDRTKGLESDELEELLKDAISASRTSSKRSTANSKPSEDQPPKKKRKTSVDSTKRSLPVFDLVEPVFTSSKSCVSSCGDAGIADTYGEATSLQHADAADKSARKKSLRFHTAKIESASARRQGARSNAVGGDDDLPYRERRKTKEARLTKEAKTMTRGQGGDDLDDVEPEKKGEKRKADADKSGNDGVDEGPDGYYELVKRKSKETKDQKKAEYEAAQAAMRPDFDDRSDAAGPRSLTRAILANKGLTPHRAKSVRNPRVKKRLRFEKAKKKISSQKAVYKGGIGETGRYDGEKSGISKVVKSVRLG